LVSSDSVNLPKFQSTKFLGVMMRIGLDSAAKRLAMGFFGLAVLVTAVLGGATSAAAKTNKNVCPGAIGWYSRPFGVPGSPCGQIKVRSMNPTSFRTNDGATVTLKGAGLKKVNDVFVDQSSKLKFRVTKDGKKLTFDMPKTSHSGTSVIVLREFGKKKRHNTVVLRVILFAHIEREGTTTSSTITGA
jgi:hypothetical protein